MTSALPTPRPIRLPKSRASKNTKPWLANDLLPLALIGCTSCLGLGYRINGLTRIEPCHCALRKIFTICYRRFRDCVSEEKSVPVARYEPASVKGCGTWAMASEEYVADFCLVARQALGEDTLAHKLFKLHFLLGAPWQPCCRRLGLDRGQFFHEVYRVQSKVGRALRDTAPYALFPVDEYFTPVVRKARAKTVARAAA